MNAKAVAAGIGIGGTVVSIIAYAIHKNKTRKLEDRIARLESWTIAFENAHYDDMNRLEAVNSLLEKQISELKYIAADIPPMRKRLDELSSSVGEIYAIKKKNTAVSYE